MHTLNKNETKKRGFSLIEVVVALGILAFVFAGTITLIVRVVSLQLSARNKTEAVALAQKKMAETVSAIGNDCAVTNPGSMTRQTYEDTRYTFEVTVKLADTHKTGAGVDVGLNSTNFYQVEVNVSWDNRDSKDNTYNLKQLVKK